MILVITPVKDYSLKNASLFMHFFEHFTGIPPHILSVYQEISYKTHLETDPRVSSEITSIFSPGIPSKIAA